MLVCWRETSAPTVRSACVSWLQILLPLYVAAGLCYVIHTVRYVMAKALDELPLSYIPPALLMIVYGITTLVMFSIWPFIAAGDGFDYGLRGVRYGRQYYKGWSTRNDCKHGKPGRW